MSESGGARECALCRKQAPLKRSHIIPRFVSRALKAPDGPTRPLLCRECEDRFGAYESTFARVVFHPLIANGRVVAKYDKWLLKFAASVCWRVIEERVATVPLGETGSRWASHLASCRETWRRFLAGKQADVGEHPIHLLAGEPIAAAAAIEMAVRGSDEAGHVCARLGPIVLCGMIIDPDAGQWRGTRVHPAGKLKSRETSVPLRYRDSIFPGARSAPPIEPGNTRSQPQ